MKQRTLIGIAVLGVVVLGVAYLNRIALRDAIEQLTKAPTPSAMPYPSPTPTRSSVGTPRPTVRPTPSIIPTSVNLDIPFVSQAPHMVWDADHEEFCEEAAVLMVSSYLKGDRSVLNPDIAETQLQAIKAYEMSAFGHFEDTSVAETVRILREHLATTKVKVESNPTVQDIKSWVSQGRAVIVPSAGRLLGNPNFKSPGPLYHMVVIKGFMADGTFITNDPGTRKGADYLYSPTVIMNAMHDWNNGDVLNGAKLVIVVG